MDNPGNNRQPHYSPGQWLAILGCAVVLPWLFGRWFDQGAHVVRNRSCQSNLRQIHRALAAYATDFDGYLPPNEPDADTVNASGWFERTRPFLGNYFSTYCPLVSGRPAKASTDYWLNQNLATQQLSAEANNRIVLVGEGGGTEEIGDSSYAYSSIPAAWTDDKSSPLTGIYLAQTCYHNMASIS